MSWSVSGNKYDSSICIERDGDVLFEARREGGCDSDPWGYAYDGAYEDATEIVTKLNACEELHQPGDEAELTEEGLRALGFDNWSFSDHGKPLCVFVGLTGQLAVFYANGAAILSIRGYYERLADCKTIGDVRRLCKALNAKSPLRRSEAGT